MPLLRFLNSQIKKFNPSQVTVYASSATFFMLLSIVPFMIALIALLQFLPFDSNQLSFIDVSFIPDDIQALFSQSLQEITQNTSIAILPFALIGTLWSSSSGFYALTKGFNTIYHRKETRRYLFVRLLCLLYTLIFLLLLIFILSMLVFGSELVLWITNAIPAVKNHFFTSTMFRSSLSLLLLTFVFTLFYKTIPNQQTRWFAEIPGAVFSAIGWWAFSMLFSIYINHFSHYANVYGSLTAIIVLMIWLFVGIYLLFIGAFLNVMLRRHRKIGLRLKKTNQ